MRINLNIKNLHHYNLRFVSKLKFFIFLVLPLESEIKASFINHILFSINIFFEIIFFLKLKFLSNCIISTSYKILLLKLFALIIFIFSPTLVFYPNTIFCYYC